MRWRRVLFVVVTATTVLAGAVSATAASAAPRSSVRTAAAAGQPLYAFNTGLVLTVGQAARRGASVRVETAAGRTGQSWVLTRGGALSPASNRALCLQLVTPRRGPAKVRMWTCNGGAAERFTRSAPSAHTPVFFLSPRKDRKLCIGAPTSVGFFGTQVPSRVVSPRRCANTQGQAWSYRNLATAVGQFTPDWAVDLVATGHGWPGSVAGVAPISNSLGEEWTVTATDGGVGFSPIDDTASCLTAGAAGQQLALSRCDGSAGQIIIPMVMLYSADVWSYVLGADDASHCLTEGKSSKGNLRPVILGQCPDTSVPGAAGIWATQAAADYNNHLPSVTNDFEVFANDPYTDSDLYGMKASAVAGSAVDLADRAGALLQTWTDLRPGSLSTENPDGSISIRPLYDLNLCLTVPGADDAAGVSLQVQACNGAADQEFSAAVPEIQGNSGAATFSPYASASLCLEPLAGVSGGSPIGLAQCPAQQGFYQDDLWAGFESWSTWAEPTP